MAMNASDANLEPVGPMIPTEAIMTIKYLNGVSETLSGFWDPVYRVFSTDSGLRDPTQAPLREPYLTNAVFAAMVPYRRSADIALVTVEPASRTLDILPAARHEVCWKPTLGIFDVAHALPSTRHELHLQIPNEYQLRCLDFGEQRPDAAGVATKIIDARSLNNDAFGANDRQKACLRIESIEFFAAMATGPRADDAKYVLDLREYRMIPQTIPLTQTGNSNTYVFNLASNTSSVSVAFQSAKAGNGSTSLSKFVVPCLSDARGAETALSRFYVNFANQNRPREENESVITYGSSAFADTNLEILANPTTTATQFFTQRYIETMTNTMQLYRPGGCENLEEWLARGAYYNWAWPRDGNDLSTRFHVFVAFKAETRAVSNPDTFSADQITRHWPQLINGVSNDINILVFDMIPRAFALSIRNGSVVGAETTSAMVGDGVRRARAE
jgi:hypothetical protein